MDRKPLLSICMIFKNEIHCLERCLKSLILLRETVPCELVMADTGATDGSREIAANYADILIDFPWINDFSAARNAVLDHASGDWFLTIDCDEWIEDIEPLVKFLQSPEIKTKSLANIIQRNYQDLDEKSDFSDAWVPRLGNRHNGHTHYIGAIHEVPGWKKAGFVDVTLAFILHHDGYAVQQKKAWKIRHDRNMKPLRKQLAKTPDDLRCLIECLQSEPDNKMKFQYAEQLITVALRTTTNSPNSGRGPSAFHQAIRAAYQLNKFDKVKEWYEKVMEYFPDSILTRLDNNGIRTLVADNQQQWDEVVEYGVKWKDALQQYDTGEGFDFKDITVYDSLDFISAVWRTRLFLMILRAACQVEKWEIAQDAVTHLTKLSIPSKELNISVSLLLIYSAHLEVSDCLSALWKNLLTNDQIKKEKHTVFCSEIIQTMTKHLATDVDHRKQTLHTLADMGACDPARCARALLSDDPADVHRELSRIENWNHILDDVVAHAVKLGLPLPDEFFRTRHDEFSNFAERVINYNKGRAAETVLQYAAVQNYDDSVVKLVWLSDLTFTALFEKDWTDDGEGVAFCKLFLQLESDLLTNLYNYDAIEENDLPVFPPVHRFGWRLCQAIKCLQNSDDIGYGRQLKAGAEDVPEMKQVVLFLLDHVDQMRPVVVTPEMQELAEQIRAILAQYSPDSPEIVLLKQSPAYQQVAYLLKGNTVVAENVTVPVPESKEKVFQKETTMPVIRSAATLDRDFAALLEECSAMTVDKLVYRMKRQFQKLPEQTRKQYEEYLNKYPLWGSFRSKMNDYQVFEEKARSLVEHADDYAWLYDRLADFRSRKLLYAILRNWCVFDFVTLDTCMERCFDEYFDLDIMPCGKDEVVVDLGAYTGDTALSFVKTYGKNAYKRYYCYEISAGTMEQCRRNTASLPNLIYCQKGAGAEKGVMYLQTSAGDASAHTLAASGQQPVEVVTLDEDIIEAITFLKMDIEGAEQDAIRGAARHIMNDRPKMALSVYHNNEDLWKIPRMIEELCPDCRFYLRYHGGNLWPTEISFLAVPQQ